MSSMKEKERAQTQVSTSIAVQDASQSRLHRHVLMTSAYNEEATIARVIESVLAQTLRPELWVVVSDGSSDGTDEIIQKYAAHHKFIRYLRMTRDPGRSFGSKVLALHSASRILEEIPAEFIGNLDADVTIEPTYFEELIAQFDGRPRLGIAGGFVLEDSGSGFKSRLTNREYSVAHAAQLVRRECYKEIGGYAVLEYGGEDWHAQTSARMRGWQARAFPDLKIFHHRHTGEGDNLLRHKFRQGRMDYAFGSDPVFEVLKCLGRLPEKPLVLGGLTRIAGFAWAAARRDSRPVSNEFIAFLRREQRGKMKSLLPGASQKKQAEDVA